MDNNLSNTYLYLKKIKKAADARGALECKKCGHIGLEPDGGFDVVTVSASCQKD